MIVEITCSSRGLKEILLDGEELDISPILNRPIDEWFLPTEDGRWSGLLPEIAPRLSDEKEHIEYKFIGKPEQLSEFFTCLEKHKQNSDNVKDGTEKARYMTASQKARCHAIIHATSVAAGAVSMVPILNLADAIPITAAQIGMVVALGKVFDMKLSDGAAEGVATALAAKAMGKAVSKLALKAVPVIGNIANAAISVSFTESLGWLVANQFARGIVPFGGDEDDDL